MMKLFRRPHYELYDAFVLRRDNHLDIRHIRIIEGVQLNTFKHRGHSYTFDPAYAFIGKSVV